MKKLNCPIRSNSIVSMGVNLRETYKSRLSDYDFMHTFLLSKYPTTHILFYKKPFYKKARLKKSEK